MRRISIGLLLLIGAKAALAADWTGPGWYRIEIFPSLEVQSEPFVNEAACRKTLPATDNVVRCVRLAKAGDEVDRAIEFFGELLKENPKSTDALNLRGLLFTRKGNSDAAFADFTNAMKVNPDDYWAFIFRGELHQKIGKRDAAIADYREALGRNPGDATTVRMLKVALKALGAEP